MARALPLATPAHRVQRELPDVLFRSPWAAMAIPLLVPLLVLFW
jgi:hypothetical protein